MFSVNSNQWLSKKCFQKCKIDCCIEVGNIKTIEIIKDLNLHQIKWLDFLYSEDDFLQACDKTFKETRRWGN